MTDTQLLILVIAIVSLGFNRAGIGDVWLFAGIILATLAVGFAAAQALG